MDKFYNLIRCFQLETFRYLAKQGWEEEAVGRINTIIEEGPLCLRSEKFMSLGLQLHMIDIFLDEVTDVVDDGMTADSWLRIMEPYFNMMRSQCDKSVFDRIYRRIFLELANTKWLRSSVEEGNSDDDISTKPLRHVNRMFRHTYIEPLPKQSVNGLFKRPEFAQQVAKSLAQKIFTVTVDPQTWHYARVKLYDLLEEYKSLCLDLGVAFVPDLNENANESKEKKNEAEKQMSSQKKKKQASETPGKTDSKAKVETKAPDSKKKSNKSVSKDGSDEKNEKSDENPMGSNKKTKVSAASVEISNSNKQTPRKNSANPPKSERIEAKVQKPQTPKTPGNKKKMQSAEDPAEVNEEDESEDAVDAPNTASKRKRKNPSPSTRVLRSRKALS